MNFNTLQISNPDPHILMITLHRPEVRNAISSEMMKELLALWEDVNLNNKWRCIILTGTDPAFCAGADLKERKDLSLETWKAQHLILVKAMKAMLQCSVPIISAVNGVAFGGGLELVLASDFAYAATNATFAQSEVKIGLIPGAFGTQHLPRAAGLARAKECIFTGKSFTAIEALKWGIINKVSEPNALIEDVLNTAKIIAENAPIAIRAAKKSLNATTFSHYDKELENYYRALETKDRAEGVLAFNEKRKPIFVGE